MQTSPVSSVPRKDDVSIASVIVRVAKRQEIDWINTMYNEVEFVHSTFDNEIIAIAEVDGVKGGVGRLVQVDATINLELGGMYVFDAYRGKGIARDIVRFLLTLVKPAQTVYCIPFKHLQDFYKQCGFTDCNMNSTVPSKVADKYNWCQKKYPYPTTLLVLEVPIDKTTVEYKNLV